VGGYLSPKITDVVPQHILSRYGFRKTAPTLKEKTDMKKTKKPTENPERSKKIYSLEVAVFTDMESAYGLTDTLNTRGYFPDIQTEKGPDGILYKVRLGLWTSKEEARNFASTLETKEEMKVTVVEVK
jgi:cell division septation protein DedD